MGLLIDTPVSMIGNGSAASTSMRAIWSSKLLVKQYRDPAFTHVHLLGKL